MDAALRGSMRAYYDARAPEYEQAYTAGTGTASIQDGRVLVQEIGRLREIVAGFGSGLLLDVACGTAYWVPHYVHNCRRVTLVDESSRMLAQCAGTMRAAAIADRCLLLQADVLTYPFPAAHYDTALVGFLISHLTPVQEARLFAQLRATLVPHGRVLVLESAWTTLRARYNAREERQRRVLNDGRAFEIYKRYVGRDDITRWEQAHGVRATIEHFGEAFCAVGLTFRQ